MERRDRGARRHYAICPTCTKLLIVHEGLWPLHKWTRVWREPVAEMFYGLPLTVEKSETLACSTGGQRHE